MTGIAQTVLHLAGMLRRTAAVVVADSALRTRRVGRVDLVAAAARASGRGSARGRQVVDLCREGVDSCPETLLRLVLVDAGLPEPAVATRVCDGIGVPVARADLAYPDSLVWIEYDGYEVHTERAAFRRDRERQNMLVGRGWLVLRFADRDLGRPRQIAEQIRAALAAAPARVDALPAGLSPETARARATMRSPFPVAGRPSRPVPRRQSA